MIPARGGSRRIPGKNIRSFCGKPIIHWSIDAAAAAGCFDRIIVSTDDPAIAAVAQDTGRVEIQSRPAALADDYATTADVMRHVAAELAASAQLPELLCCLYATAPFVQPDDLCRGQQLVADADYAVPVTRFAYPIQRALRIAPTGRLDMFDPAQAAVRSQDLEEAWHDAGQFYWGTASAWQQCLPVFAAGSVPIPLPAWRVQDIDTEEDWTRAEALFRALGLA